MCDLGYCNTFKKGTISVIENIGDGSWKTMICKDCAERLGIKEGDDLPEHYVVKKILQGLKNVA